MVPDRRVEAASAFRQALALTHFVGAHDGPFDFSSIGLTLWALMRIRLGKRTAAIVAILCSLVAATDRRTSGNRSVGMGISFELQLRGDLARGNCRTEQETLTLLAAQGLQELKLFLRFNPLGKRH